MTRIDRSALVMFSAQQMYELVNDIESYPQFMQGCQEARVVSRTDDEVVGELTLGKAGLKYSFTTRNVVVPGQSMSMNLVEGPFRSFSAAWRFIALNDSACKVTLEMEFDFAGGVVGYALQKLFDHSANTLVDALVNRAQIVYVESTSS
jgi:ribosome-associated toxin RatA of RatAB toxin-antitoxin module